jgi:hypothetical protein
MESVSLTVTAVAANALMRVHENIAKVSCVLLPPGSLAPRTSIPEVAASISCSSSGVSSMAAAPRLSSRRRIFLTHRIEYQLRASQIQLVASPESGNSAPGNPRHISPGKPGKLKGVGKSGSYLDDLAPGSVRAALESA